MNYYLRLFIMAGPARAIQYLLILNNNWIDRLYNFKLLLKSEKKWLKKLSAIYSMLTKNKDIKLLNKNQVKEINDFFKNFDLKPNELWHNIYYRLNGNFDKRFIDDFIFYQSIEPELNNPFNNKVFSDKNYYEKFLPKDIQPATILRCINYHLLDEDYHPVCPSNNIDTKLSEQITYIIKPSINSSGGRDVFPVIYSEEKFILNGKYFTLSELKNHYKGNFIIQEKLKQNDFLNEIYPFSLNTIRIMTLRMNNEVNILSSIIRFGTNNSVVDNVSSGGICFGVNSSGNFSPFGLAYNFEKVFTHPNSGFRFEDNKFPFFSSVKDLAINLHNYLYHYNLVSWDLAIDDQNRPRFIEYNLFQQEINYMQILNGPLFGKITDQVLGDIRN